MTFAAEAVGEAAGQPGADTVALRGALKRVWRAPIDNRLKEVFHRLAGGAIPGGRGA